MLDTPKPKTRSFIGINLNPGITPFNLIGFYLMNFWLFVMLGAVLGFMAIILEDPDYYNIDKTQLGKQLGNISMICEAVVIAEELVMGVIVDTFGRKIPLLTGWLVAGIGFALVPMFKSLYPSFLIVRMLIYCGLIVGANIPLLPDYIQKESMGLATSIGQTVATAAYLFSGSGLYTISEHVELAYIYYGIATVSVLIFLILCCSIKDSEENKKVI